MGDTKICTKCKIDKPLDQYYVHKETKDGRRGSCKKCSSDEYQLWRQNNLNRVREYDRKRDMNPDRVAARKWGI